MGNPNTPPSHQGHTDQTVERRMRSAVGEWRYAGACVAYAARAHAHPPRRSRRTTKNTKQALTPSPDGARQLSISRASTPYRKATRPSPTQDPPCPITAQSLQRHSAMHRSRQGMSARAAHAHKPRPSQTVRWSFCDAAGRPADKPCRYRGGHVRATHSEEPTRRDA
eukprot:scaffold22834_cov119-Isochrysis_galbana.AAC.5